MKSDLTKREARLQARKSIHALEDMLLDLPKEDQIDLDVLTTHHFAPGVYARELFIPAGVVLTGKIHKTRHLNIISKGRIAVATEQGPKVVEAPHIMVSDPGTKRAGYALEDTIWITIHVTEETDLDKIEQQVIAEDYDDLPRIEGDS